MGRFLLYLLIFVTGASLLYAPWVSGLAYVVNSLLQPQHIWNWVFAGIPIFKITAALAILGLFSSLAQKKTTLGIFKYKQNLMILVIWIWMHLSHMLSPYQGAEVSVPPEIVLGTINSILLMYFVLLPLFSNKKAIKYLCYTFVIVGIYYTYWANVAYVNQEWYRFVNGRLVGPHGSPYRDANVLSTLIVMSLPFMILLYFRVKPKIKLLIIFLVPLTWHALVLFSSRAALLAAVTSLLLVGYVIRSKRVNFVIVISFILFMGYQGAMLIERASNTVEISQSSNDAPINPRLISWEAGFKLIPEYPIFGAGVQMFEAATQNHFPGMTPHVAHNTFLNFASNTGLLTGLLFLALIFMALKRLLEVRNSAGSVNDIFYYAVVSSSISLFGFFICSIFLDLIIFEPFYMALMINLIAYDKWKNDSKNN